jgi:pimeloyl-ACP methyl ester carboxylesterase
MELGPMNDRIDFARHTDTVDFIEAGAGPLVVLIHSSMAGARQWAPLISDLADRCRVRAVNLFGYGATPPWSGTHAPSLGDFARLVACAVPDTANDISIVGHSFGAAVAMQAASDHLRGRVKHLVLIEPSLFYLLEQGGRAEAFAEIAALAKTTQAHVAAQNPAAAAELFIDYWCGQGTWATSSPGRQAAFAQSIALLLHEWHAVLSGEMTPAAWIEALPRHTLLMSSAWTTRPSREIVASLLDARPDWTFASICDASHMAPLTHPHLVNPLIKGFLAASGYPT